MLPAAPRGAGGLRPPLFISRRAEGGQHPPPATPAGPGRPPGPPAAESAARPRRAEPGRAEPSKAERSEAAPLQPALWPGTDLPEPAAERGWRAGGARAVAVPLARCSLTPSRVPACHRGLAGCPAASNSLCCRAGAGAERWGTGKLPRPCPLARSPRQRL
ncbi:uncharacterized protein [Molothrus aeneus]|uniref:uncharacterized protein n=1 Tax=Molothrus aeneus TaxID=84833 RepID=UPI0034578983